MSTIKTDPLIKPPCDCRGKDCTLQTNFEGSQYSKYKVTHCLTHGTTIWSDPIRVTILFNFGDGFFLEEVLK